MMNKKAEELGMEQTHFVDCCGLTESKEHFTRTGCGTYVAGTAAKISELCGIFRHLDGRHHACDGKGKQSLYAYQHE